MENILKNIIFVICAAFLTCVIWTSYFPVEEQGIYQNVIRLHVISAGDSERDLQAKLAVRDALLPIMSEAFDNCTYDEALKRSKALVNKAEQTANSTLTALGVGYTATVTFTREEYPTRDYDGISLPCGEYMSLRVMCGNAQGKNWWCILFPSLCYGSSKSVSRIKNSGNTAVFTKSNIRYRFAFKLLELFN